ncbi:uncharacterized protein LOC128039805 [Gossypium raimondii]|uniref:uncharacterized protein LOC128039805 n=1 Tax=Gossypium raimondii TaxID=29730 RepID=UPI00227CBF3E|nr:uncharacterized protein LOC128039805 [Gossypium raimondii]
MVWPPSHHPTTPPLLSLAPPSFPHQATPSLSLFLFSPSLFISSSPPPRRRQSEMLHCCPHHTMRPSELQSSHHRFIIKNTRSKSKVVVPASKKWKSPSTTFSSSASAKTRHPFLRFFVVPQEDLFQLLRVRPLSLGRCIDWAIVE